MTQVEKMWKAINSFCWNKQNTACSLSIGEWKELANIEKHVDAVSYAFDYGFIKGIRYQKAQEKKKRKAVKA